MAGMLAAKACMTAGGMNFGLRLGGSGFQVHRQRILERKRLECLGEDCLGIVGGSVDPAKNAHRCRRTNNCGQVPGTWLMC